MKQWITIKKILTLLKEYKYRIVAICVCLLGSTGINICLPLLSEKLVDDGFLKNDLALIIKLSIGLLFFYWIDTGISFIKEKKRIDLYTDIKYLLQEKAFHHLLKMKMSFYKEKNDAELLQNIDTDVTSIASVADESVIFAITEIFTVVGGIIGLCFINLKLAILTLLYIPVKILISQILAMKNYKAVINYIERKQEYSSWFGDSIAGIKEIRFFRLGDRKKREFNQIQEKLIKSERKSQLLQSMNTLLDNMGLQTLISVIYILGGVMLTKVQISVGGILAFITYTDYVTAPISAIISVALQITDILPSAERYFTFLEEEEEESGNIIRVPEGNLIFKDVSFSYTDEVPVLQHINITINNKKKVAVIGKNGQGKTTLLQLIMNLYQPQSGKIYYGGREISEYDLEIYRSMISVVSQDVYLFNDTIKNNLCLGKDIEEKRLKEVINMVGLDTLVYEKGDNFKVGKNGSMLSGGEKQKISLARAMLHKKAIVILDEATSNVDETSETIMKDVLFTELKEQTVIYITHKKQILELMDDILLVEEGTVRSVKAEYKNSNY